VVPASSIVLKNAAKWLCEAQFIALQVQTTITVREKNKRETGIESEWDVNAVKALIY
jgi:hypothetical protein